MCSASLYGCSLGMGQHQPSEEARPVEDPPWNYNLVASGGSGVGTPMRSQDITCAVFGYVGK